MAPDRARTVTEALEIADVRIADADAEIARLRTALETIKGELEDCPQPLPKNGYQGSGVQDWINSAYAAACNALDGED